MHIWIDESGPFAGIGQMPSPSCVGALVVPDAKIADLERLYSRVRHNLPKVKGEVKGRLLSHRQVAAVVDILRRCEALFEVSMLEFGMHTEAQIQGHQTELCAKIGANITKAHSEATKAWVRAVSGELANFKTPAFVQSIVTMQLLRIVLDHATVYFSQRRPTELAAFHWIIDGKEPLVDKTPWEKWWSDFLLPYLQSQSVKRPGIHFALGDYSHFEKHHAIEYPEYLLPVIGEENAVGINLRSVFGDNVRFSTRTETGLELVDVLTNGFRRALLGHLEPEGWLPIRALMIHRNEQYPTVLSFNSDQPQLPYRDVLKAFRTGGKSMLVPKHLAG